MHDEGHAQILVSGSYLNDLWEWSPGSRIWSNIGLQANSLENPSARSHIGFTRLGDSLIVFGGLGQTGLVRDYFKLFASNRSE